MNCFNKTLCLGALLALMSQQVVAQSSPAPTDELKFRGTEATTDESISDTHIVTDATPTNNGAPTPTNNDQTSLDFSNNNNNNDYNQQQPAEFPLSFIMPLDGFMNQDPFSGPPAPFGHGNGRGPFRGPNRRPGSFLDSLFGGNLFDHIDRHAQAFERKFSELERQAGEGEDVSYFQRNGQAYVRTCTTRRVSSNDQQNQQKQQQAVTTTEISSNVEPKQMS